MVVTIFSFVAKLLSQMGVCGYKRDQWLQGKYSAKKVEPPGYAAKVASPAFQSTTTPLYFKTYE